MLIDIKLLGREIDHYSLANYSGSHNTPQVGFIAIDYFDLKA